MTREAPREELEATLAHLPVISGTATDRHSIPADRLLILATAARKQLALMPQDCECMSKHYDERVGHGPCHGSGKVYPQETVEKIAAAVTGKWVNDGTGLAVAVLDALASQVGESE